MQGREPWYVYPIDERSTAADGVCIFKSLEPDAVYQFRVRAKGFGVGGGSIKIQPGKRVEVGPTMLKKADSFVAGVVVDEKGEPVPDVEVSTIAQFSNSASTRSDIQGRFRFEEIVPGDKVNIYARSADRADGVQDIPAGTDNAVVPLIKPRREP